MTTFDLDERTISAWQDRAASKRQPHAKQVQEEIVCKGQVELGQIQVDEFYTKTVWRATLSFGVTYNS